MGFWGSLWEGVKEGAKWVADHSGDILKAGTAIAKVAGGLVAEGKGTIAFANDPVWKLYDDYEKASQVLLNKAEITTSPTNRQEVVKTGKVCGVWWNPTPFASNKPLNFNMKRDISKLLKASAAPAQILHKGTWLDTAQVVSEAMFANSPTLFADLLDGEDPVQVTSFVIRNDTGDCQIEAKHAYYDVPLGSTNENNAWHGAIHAKTTASEKFLQAEAAKFSRALINDDGNEPVTPGASWTSTINVDWIDRETAEQNLKKFETEFKKRFPEYTVKTNSSTGYEQLLQIAGPVGATPADIRSAVTDTIKGMLPPQNEALPSINVTLSTLN
ncbi:hypothetical protein J3459_022395 [Metarhizium acridum]|nr:hypothetical protein J3459_022395 [Metarhizium acridum]